jgi:hypothetical protein
MLDGPVGRRVGAGHAPLERLLEPADVERIWSRYLLRSVRSLPEQLRMAQA